MKKSININDKFKFLTIKNIITIKNRKFAICDCVCGNVVTKRVSYLAEFNNTNCGCMPLWKRNCVGLISQSYFYGIKYGAESRNLEFNITKEYIWNIYENQNGKCALSGLLIEFGTKDAHEIKTASLDRIDNSKGYIEGNVWWVDKKINQMKLDFTVNEFIEMCNKVATYNSLKY